MFYRLLTILVILILTVVYAVYQRKALEGHLVSESQSGSVLRALPDTSFESLEKERIPLAKFYQDGVELLVIHFWGTWCAPCEAELPELLSLIKRYEGRPGVKFLLVAVNDESIKVKKHLKTLAGSSGASIYWLIDNDNVYRDLFGTTRVPETYVFSSDKSTLRKYVGPQEWNKSMFFQSFDEMIQMSTRKL